VSIASCLKLERIYVSCCRIYVFILCYSVVPLEHSVVASSPFLNMRTKTNFSHISMMIHLQAFNTDLFQINVVESPVPVLIENFLSACVSSQDSLCFWLVK
jgi:hypothetical protein